VLKTRGRAKRCRIKSIGLLRRSMYHGQIACLKTGKSTSPTSRYANGNIPLPGDWSQCQERLRQFRQCHRREVAGLTRKPPDVKRTAMNEMPEFCFSIYQPGENQPPLHRSPQ